MRLQAAGHLSFGSETVRNDLHDPSVCTLRITCQGGLEGGADGGRESLRETAWERMCTLSGYLPYTTGFLVEDKDLIPPSTVLTQLF